MSQCNHDCNQGRNCTCAYNPPMGKRCTMNCGSSAGDTRSRKSIMDNCEDCETLRESDFDHGAVDSFASAMILKLEEKRKQGRNGWRACSTATLSQMLVEHVTKGDPVDVANFCMMLYRNGQRIDPTTNTTPFGIVVLSVNQENIRVWWRYSPENLVIANQYATKHSVELHLVYTYPPSVEVPSVLENDYYQLLCASQIENAQIKSRLLKTLGDDALAMSYQSIGQYRTALIKQLSGAAANTTEDEGEKK